MSFKERKAKEIRETRPSSRNTYAGLRHMNMRIEEGRESRNSSILDSMVAKRDLPVQSKEKQKVYTSSTVPSSITTNEKIAAKRAQTQDNRPIEPMIVENASKIQYYIENSSNECSIEDDRKNDLYKTTVITDHPKLQNQPSTRQAKNSQRFERTLSSRTELLQGVIDQLDFSFFNDVYSSYNTIWQLVLKLPLHGNSLVQKSDFFEVLKNCKIIQSESENIFCAFLLFSCSQKKNTRGLNGEKVELDLLDFRTLLKSVLVCLKRQTLATNRKNRSTVGQNDHEKVFNAEMFIIDHFWHTAIKPTGDETITSDSNRRQGADDIQTGRYEETLEYTVAMSEFQEKMFEFFNRREIPLLQIIDIETIITECFKYLISKNKRKDRISKRTLKKVVTRHCHGLILKSLTSFIKDNKEQKQSSQSRGHASLVPIFMSQSDGNTTRGASNITSQRYQLTNPSNSNRNMASWKASAEKNNTQKLSSSIVRSTNESISDKRNETAGSIEKADDSTPFKKSIEKKQNLCKQLEQKIVVKKLESALKSALLRLAFQKIKHLRVMLSAENHEQSSISGNKKTNSFDGSIGADLNSLHTRVVAEHKDQIVVTDEETVEEQKQVNAIISERQSNTTYINTNISMISPKVLQKGNSYNYLSVEDSATNQTNIQPVKNDNREPQTSTRNCHQKNCKSLQNKYIQFSNSDQPEEDFIEKSHLQSQEPCQHKAQMSQFLDQHVVSTNSEKGEIEENQSQEVTKTRQSNKDNKTSGRIQFRSQSQVNQSGVMVIDMNNCLSPSQEDQKGVSRSSQASEHNLSTKGEDKIPVNNSATINSDMLRNLIQTEANNQQCLKELENRIKMLESSNQETGTRKENIILEQSNDLPDFHGQQPPPNYLSAPMRYNGEYNIYSMNSQNQPQVEHYETQGEPEEQQLVDYIGSQQISESDRLGGTQQMNQIPSSRKNGLETATQGTQFATLEELQYKRNQIVSEAAYELEQSATNQEDYTNEYEYTHGSKTMSKLIRQSNSTGEQNIYENSNVQSPQVKNGHQNNKIDNQQNIQNSRVPYSDYGEEVMDFEANQEQRPRQATCELQQKLSCSEFISSATSQGEIQQIPDQEYIGHTRNNSNEYQYDLPVSVQNSSPEKVSIQQIRGYHHAQPSIQSQKEYGIYSNNEFMSYAISDTKTDDTRTNNSNELYRHSQNYQSNQQEYIHSDQPLQVVQEHINQSQDDQSIVSYPKQQEPSIRQQTCNEDCLYFKKYKKVKQKAKLILKERRELVSDEVNKNEKMLEKNEILQLHLEKTAACAQEVSNQNQMLQNDLHFAQIRLTLGKALQIHQVWQRIDKLTELKGHFNHWRSQVDKICFAEEVYREQQMINMTRQRILEEDNTEKTNKLRFELAKTKASFQSQALKNLLKHLIQKRILRTVCRWKQFVQEQRRIHNFNKQEEDIRDVVFQMNKFRVALVCHQIKDMLHAKIKTTKMSAFSNILGHSRQIKLSETLREQQNMQMAAMAKAMAFKKPVPQSPLPPPRPMQSQLSNQRPQTGENQTGTFPATMESSRSKPISPSTQSRTSRRRTVDAGREKKELRPLSPKGHHWTKQKNLLPPQSSINTSKTVMRQCIFSDMSRAEPSEFDASMLEEEKNMSGTQGTINRSYSQPQRRNNLQNSSKKDVLNERRSKLKQQAEYMEGIAQIHQFFAQKMLSLDQQTIKGTFNFMKCSFKPKKIKQPVSRQVVTNNHPRSASHGFSAATFTNSSMENLQASQSSFGIASSNSLRPRASNQVSSNKQLVGLSQKGTARDQQDYNPTSTIKQPQLRNTQGSQGSLNSRSSNLSQPRILGCSSPSMHNIHKVQQNQLDKTSSTLMQSSITAPFARKIESQTTTLKQRQPKWNY